MNWPNEGTNSLGENDIIVLKHMSSGPLISTGSKYSWKKRPIGVVEDLQLILVKDRKWQKTHRYTVGGLLCHCYCFVIITIFGLILCICVCVCCNKTYNFNKPIIWKLHKDNAKCISSRHYWENHTEYLWGQQDKKFIIRDSDFS